MRVSVSAEFFIYLIFEWYALLSVGRRCIERGHELSWKKRAETPKLPRSNLTQCRETRVSSVFHRCEWFKSCQAHIHLLRDAPVIRRETWEA